jgi:hypothetical protein
VRDDGMTEREKLERTIEMLRYSIDNAESQKSMYKEGDLEWIYASKIIESCKETLAQKEKEMEEMNKKEAGAEPKG